jgi:galactokinase
VTALFAREFGGSATVVASAPGRVNLIGEHTDYNGGEVLPIAIARRTCVAVRRTARARSRALSTDERDAGEWDAASPARTGGWWDYVSGVQGALVRRGMDPGAVEIAVASDVPAGAGLSSSAALEVATATALTALASITLDGAELALLARDVECEFVGVSCGIMDQFASSLSRADRALHIWCDTARTEHVPMSEAVLIFDTAVPRELRGSEFNTRQRECAEALMLLRRVDPQLPHLAAATPEQLEEARLPSPLDRRAAHVVQETRRVGETVSALRSEGTLPGTLLFDSHESLRSKYECSTRELDWFVDHASRAPGITGARLTGAGWGGCAIAVGDEEALAAAAPGLASEYARAFALQPRVWITHASAGARVESHSA